MVGAHTSHGRRMAARIQAVTTLVRELTHIFQDIEDLRSRCPRVAFVGDQSSGKSTLGRRLFGFDFPADVATCTRVPIEVSTEPGDSHHV